MNGHNRREYKNRTWIQIKVNGLQCMMIVVRIIVVWPPPPHCSNDLVASMHVPLTKLTEQPGQHQHQTTDDYPNRRVQQR